MPSEADLMREMRTPMAVARFTSSTTSFGPLLLTDLSTLDLCFACTSLLTVEIHRQLE